MTYFNHLPDSITHLELGWKYDQPIENLPDSIVCLKLKYSYKNKIIKLPSSLQELYYGDSQVDISLALQGKYIRMRSI